MAFESRDLMVNVLPRRAAGQKGCPTPTNNETSLSKCPTPSCTAPKPCPTPSMDTKKRTPMDLGAARPDGLSLMRQQLRQALGQPGQTT